MQANAPKISNPWYPRYFCDTLICPTKYSGHFRQFPTYCTMHPFPPYHTPLKDIMPCVPICHGHAKRPKKSENDYGHAHTKHPVLTTQQRPWLPTKSSSQVHAQHFLKNSCTCAQGSGGPEEDIAGKQLNGCGYAMGVPDLLTVGCHSGAQDSLQHAKQASIHIALLTVLLLSIAHAPQPQELSTTGSSVRMTGIFPLVPPACQFWRSRVHSQRLPQQPRGASPCVPSDS